MIAIDPTETTTASRCPPIPTALPYPTLETDTGADIIISPLSIPVTSALLNRHLNAGALLIQRKSGADLPASITDGRLYRSLAKMRSLGVRQFQCVLLTTGYYWPGRNGKTLIVTPNLTTGKLAKQHYPHITYTSIPSAIESWTWLGGVHYSLTCDAEIPGWILNTERRLKQKVNQGGARELWPVPLELYDPPADDDPLQESILVTGWRALLSSFKGAGPSRVNSLNASMIQHNIPSTLIDALVWIIIAPDDTIPGWGQKTREKIINQLGGPDAWKRLLTTSDAIEITNITQETADRMNAIIADWNASKDKEII